MSPKKLLIVGCSSKIAKDFVARAKGDYELYGTFANHAPDAISFQRCYQLDLSSKESVLHFLDKINEIAFDGVLFFAATYGADESSPGDYFDQLLEDIKINTLSQSLIARHIAYTKNAKVLFFGDSGLRQPKKNFTSYSISKATLHAVAEILAVELADKARVISFLLGPTKPEKSAETAASGEYFKRNAVRVDDPAAGLVSYILFLLQEDNLSITGIQIPYDGGAYLLRK